MSSNRPNARAAIVDAAFAQLAAGTAPLTLDEVAKAANVSRQAIYLHFKSRNDLILAVAEHARNDEATARLIAALPRAKTPRAGIRAFVRAVAAMHQRSGAAQLTVEALRRMDRDLEAAWARRPAGRASSAQQLAARIAGVNALSRSLGRAAELMQTLAGPALFDQLVTRCGWTTSAYETELTRVLLAAVIVTGREDVPFAEEPRKGRAIDGSRSSRDEDARKDGGRVESRRRRGVGGSLQP